MHRHVPTGVATVFLLFATPASAIYVNSYAVSAHRSCKASNLPNTVTEVEKFFASQYLPQDVQKNFFWTNSRVRASEWQGSGDYLENQGTANGFDGADAGLINYIASHGITANGRYKALAGGGNAGCEIRSSDMEIGDQQARYLILSTCQGLKIGSGDQPSQPGENPSKTWRDANKGLNCIFGYSNDMLDASEYGENLLRNLATTDDTLVEAFFRASRQINYDNIPAVLCFGLDTADARRNLETARRFTAEHYGSTGSAWAYRKARKLKDRFVLPTNHHFPAFISVARQSFDPLRIATRLVGTDVRKLKGIQGLSVYRGNDTTLTFDPNTAVLSWQTTRRLPAREIKLKDDSAIAIARDFLKQKQLLPETGELVPTYVIDRVEAFGDNQVVTDKLIVFHQKINGLLALGSLGSYEVNVNADGLVTAVTASAAVVTRPALVVEVKANSVKIESLIDEALARLQRRLGENTKITLVETRFGFDTGSYYETRQRRHAVLEVVVAARQGEYGRRYVERIALQ